MNFASLLLCVLVIGVGVGAHESPLGHQIESLETKLSIVKAENTNKEIATWHILLLHAHTSHMKGIYAFYIKWLSACIFLLGFLHCAMLVFRDIHHTILVYRETERNTIINQQNRIRELKRRLDAIVRNEGSPFSAGRGDLPRIQAN